MTEIIDLPIATLDETGNVPLEQLGNAPSSSGSVPGFQATHAYTKGQQITQGGQLYAATASFTSGASFSGADWTLLGGLAGVDGGTVT